MKMRIMNMEVNKAMKKGLYDIIDQNRDYIKIRVNDIICEIQNGLKRTFYKLVDEESMETVYVGTLY